MYSRLEAANRWLEWLGLTQRSNLELMRERLAGAMPIGPLDAFAALLEPVKGYERHRSPYGAETPFNHLADAIPPESDAARAFANAVDVYLGSPSADGATALRAMLTAWKRAADDVRPMLGGNSLLLEDAPVADDVATLCRIGLEALGYRSAPAPQGWKQAALSAIKEASQHTANLLIPLAPPVQKLVEATP